MAGEVRALADIKLGVISAFANGNLVTSLVEGERLPLGVGQIGVNLYDKVIWFKCAETGLQFEFNMQTGDSGNLALVYFASDNAVSTTTSTTFQSKLILNDVFTAGTYAIDVAYGFNHDDTSQDFEAQFLLDGVPFGQNHTMEMQDAAGTFGSTGTNQKIIANRRLIVPGITAGSHNIEVQYRTSQNGAESSMWDTSILAWNLTELAAL